VKKAKRIWLVGLVLITIFALVLSRIEPAKLLVAMSGISWKWVFLALVLNIVNIGVESLRWQQVIFTVKREASFQKILAALLVGFFGNIIFPLRIGDGFRIYFLSKQEKIKVSDVIWTFFLDRIGDILFFLVLIGITGLYFPLSGETEKAFHLLLFVISVLIVILTILAFVFTRGDTQHFSGWRKRLRNFLERLVLVWRGLRSARNLTLFSLLASLSWLLRVLIIWAMFESFHMRLPFVVSVIGLIMVNLGLAAVNTPANIGGFELALIAALKLFSVDTETALSCALLLHLVEVIPTFILGGAVIIKTGFRFERVRKEAEEIEKAL